MLKIHNNKTLRLTNVLMQDISPKGLEQVDLFVEQMVNYIKNHGAQQIGPCGKYSAMRSHCTSVRSLG